jgi:hypothetical protein
MKSLLTSRNLIIAFLAILGVSGLIEALPRAHESTGDLLIDAGILALIIAVSVVFANIRAARRKSRG